MKFIWNIIFFLPFLLQAQTEKEVKEYFIKSKQIEKLYYVLSSDENIKNGSFITYYYTEDKETWNTFIKVEGAYKNNNKDGVWTEYAPPIKWNDSLLAGGVQRIDTFENGIKIGISTIYKKNVIEKYDNDAQTYLCPKFNILLHYPKQAVEMGIEGKVIIEVQLNAQCFYENPIVIQALDYGCTEAAFSSISSYNKLVEAYILNHPIECVPQKIFLPFNFKIL